MHSFSLNFFILKSHNIICGNYNQVLTRLLLNEAKCSMARCIKFVGLNQNEIVPFYSAPSFPFSIHTSC